MLTECQEQNRGLSAAWVTAYTSVCLPHVDTALQTGIVLCFQDPFICCPC